MCAIRTVVILLWIVFRMRWVDYFWIELLRNIFIIAISAAQQARNGRRTLEKVVLR